MKRDSLKVKMQRTLGIGVNRIMYLAEIGHLEGLSGWWGPVEGSYHCTHPNDYLCVRLRVNGKE